MKSGTHRDLGEDVEHEGEAGQVHPDPLAPEPLHHVLRQSAHLSRKDHFSWTLLINNNDNFSTCFFQLSNEKEASWKTLH